MRQRVMIAIALAKNPSLLIADEPTTALDVTIQAQILDLMLELKEDNADAAVVLITHDLAVVAETCERVIVMYGGEIWGTSTTKSEFKFLDATEMPLLGRLLNCAQRWKHDFVSWWLKLQRLSAIALLQAIDLF